MEQTGGLSPQRRPLLNGHIRLLSVKPSANPDAQIEGCLSPARIEERPFEALSYVWGIEDAIHCILVDDEPLLVRPNLYAALKELRLRDQPRTLWIDSICINQSDVAERNSQVKQMGAIYSYASQVIIWLGAEDPWTGAALDFIQGLSKLDSAILKRIEDNGDLPWEQRSRIFAALGMRHGLENYDEVVSGLVRLMDNAWWTRIWTVQEIVLAKSAVLRCGPKSASWAHLNTLSLFAFEVSHRNTLTLGRPMDESVFDEVTAQVSRLYAGTRALTGLSHRVSNGLEIDLQMMLWAQSSTRQSTDPLDMIYALVGLLTDKKAIDIDYKNSKKQVYTDAMRVMLEQDANLLSLHFLQDSHLERDTELPSWVPDFGILHRSKTLTLAVASVGATLIVRPLYNASLGDAGDWKPPKFVGEDRDALQIEGVLVDEVRDVGDVYQRFSGEWTKREAQLRTMIDDWHQLIPEKEDKYIAGGTNTEAFWRTLTLDLLLTNRSYLAGNPNRRDTRLPKRAAGMPPTTANEETEVLEGILDAPPPKTILEKLHGRRFFITKSGYFGLGPASMRSGDSVCILRGAHFPTVIRSSADRQHHIIGEW